MSRIYRAAVVPYSVDQMYALVSDVQSYPLFFPHCVGAELVQRTEEEVTVTLLLMLHRIRYRLTTRNAMQPGSAIHIQLVSGPFRHLQANWRFESQEQIGSCRVSFDIEFEFKNRLLRAMLGGVFQPLAESLLDAFCLRAQQVYAP